jgi:hypothetical protein
MTIRKVKMFNSEFKATRTAYSSNSVFLVFLVNSSCKYDPEAVGELIFPEGFASVQPPGPSFGFGSLFLSDSEQDGKVAIDSLASRTNEDGEAFSVADVMESLETYFDGYFEVLENEKVIKQISWEQFHDFLARGAVYSHIHLVEFEPDE